MISLILSLWLAGAPPEGRGLEASPVAAQQEAATVEEVVVNGRRPDVSRESLNSFVRAIGEPTRRRQLARWNGEICPRAIGAVSVQNAVLAERVREVARSLRLRVGKPDCKPNIIILVTNEGDRANKALAARQIGVFGARGRVTAQGFLTSTAPVRWWHGSATTPADGRSSGVGYGSGAFFGVPVFAEAAPSNLTPATRESLQRALVVVDARRSSGVPLGALSAHVAMTALAQIDPDADLGEAPTILSLFRDRDAERELPATLTSWDMAYLEALYRGDPESLVATQRAGIVNRMERTLRSGG